MVAFLFNQIGPQQLQQFQLGLGENSAAAVVLGTSYLIIVTSLIWKLKLTPSTENIVGDCGDDERSRTDYSLLNNVSAAIGVKY